VPGELLDLLLREGADDDPVDVARQGLGGVVRRLAARQLQPNTAADREVQGLAAELMHTHLEGHARAGRGLGEDQGDRLACERAAVSPRAAFHFGRERDHPTELGGRQILEAAKVSDHGRKRAAFPAP
jgi:hypothetical protein